MLRKEPFPFGRAIARAKAAGAAVKPGRREVAAAAHKVEGDATSVRFLQDDAERLVGPGFRPRRHEEIAEVEVDGRLVVGHEKLGRLLALDAVSSQLWRLFDGTVTLEELASDLSGATALDLDTARNVLVRLAKALANDGFLVEPVVGQPEHRRTHPWLSPDSCAGRRIGLGRAEFAQVGGRSNWFRIGSTLPGVVGPLTVGLELVPVDRRFLETIVLRGTRSRSGAPRLQQIFSTKGELLHACRDDVVAIDAFQRTVSARIELRDGGAWVEGLVLVRDGGAVLIDRTFTRLAVDIRTELHARGIDWAPAGILRLDGTTVTAVANRVDGATAIPFEVRTFVVPPRVSEDPAHELIAALELARGWNQEHLTAFRNLVAQRSLTRWWPRETEHEFAGLLDGILG